MVPPPSSSIDWNKTTHSLIAGCIVLALIVMGLVMFASPFPACPANALFSDTPGSYVSSTLPIFTDPAVKLSETADPAFTDRLFHEAVAYEPLLNTSGTQVHMGFWSGKGNHGRLVMLLDAINDVGVSDAGVPQRALWDEGVTTYDRYPSYVTMLNEHWYERSAVRNGTVVIYGRAYADPFPVTLDQADRIWGQYSERYAEMAAPIAAATGNPVKVWCFVEGARANRIFYLYEFPKLRELERQGVVAVFFARTGNANWTQSSDWIAGTDNAPRPVSG